MRFMEKMSGEPYQPAASAKFGVGRFGPEESMTPPFCFEYTAVVSETSHGPESGGAPVHCVVEMQVASAQGHLRSTAELEAAVSDLILFALNPGPYHCMNQSKVWKVDEGRLAQLGRAPKVHCIGGCRIHHYAG